MEFQDLAKKHFGQVHYIWTHRDIKESLPSFLSMVAHSQTIFSDQVTLEHVTRHWIKKTGYMLARGIQFRNAHPEEKYTDVHYKQLVSSPLEVLENIYRFGDPVSNELKQKFQETEKLNTQYRYGKHTYKLEDFGIKPEEITSLVEMYEGFLKTLK